METVTPEPVHLSTAAIEAGLDEIRQAPADVGVVELIVRRPAVDEREVLEEGRLDERLGLVGDTWIGRRSGRTEDGSPHPDMQLNVMNARVIRLLADSADRERWALAGDQLYLDLDISEANLPAGTRLALGSAVIEVTDQPHTGCQKFSSRFGLDALRFVNSPVGRELHLRGINARVVEGGTVRAGDTVRKLPA
jgi:MOSC domain-containing protein YiiM